MLNDITNELSNYRAERLLTTSNNQINNLVHDAMERIAPGSLSGLAGVDAHSDGITRQAWDQAVSSAESVAATVYGRKAIDDMMDLTDTKPVVFGDVLDYIGERVAESILTLHGYASVRKPHVKDTVYVVVTCSKYGYISNVEVMSDRPNLDPQDEVDGSTITVYEAGIDGGDSRQYDWK